MAISRDRQSLIRYYKRQYCKHLSDLQRTIKSELEGVQDEVFTPSTAIQTMYINVIVAAERLKALTEIEEK